MDNVFCKKFRDVFPPSVDLDGSKEQLNNIDKVLGVSVSVVMGVCKTYVCWSIQMSSLLIFDLTKTKVLNSLVPKKNLQG